jgi:hypothetical protein
MCGEVIDAKEKHHLQITEIVNGAMRAIRAHPRVGRRIPVVVAIEACSSDATWLAPIFMEHEDVLVMSEFKGESGRFGVPKNPAVLIGLVGATQALLSRDMVSIPADAVAYSTPFAKRASTMRDYREALHKQFSNFRIDHSTGKTSGKAHGENDDLIITFMMCLYWMTKFCVNNPQQYMEFKMRYPDRTWFTAMAPYLATDGY